MHYLNRKRKDFIMSNYYTQQLPWTPNYDVNAIPPHEIPDPLTCFDGTKVTTPEEWFAKRRPELMAAYRKYFYGEELPLPDKTEYTLLEEKTILNGLGIRRQIELKFSMASGTEYKIIMLVYLPAGKKDVPVFTTLNFVGNHVVEADPDIIPTGNIGDLATERGAASHRYPLDLILGKGYAIAAVTHHDIFFDDQDTGWQNSVCTRLFQLDPEKYSAIGVWSWGLSRMLDCLTAFVPEVDPEKAIVCGHSRLGKTSLWTMARDERFKMACVNDSGCGGAALNRRLYGETLFAMEHYNKFGFWFVPLMKEYCLTPEKLPVEQNELIALAAPRYIAVHSATEDQWADPTGEYLSTYHAGSVFQLFGMSGPESETPPPPETAVGNELSYYCRIGKHDIVAADFAHYIDRADQLFGIKR